MRQQEAIKRAFFRLSDKEPRLFRSPGRINLMGDHTDYNMGWVLPGAIDRFIYMGIDFNDSEECHVLALDKDEQYSFGLDRGQKDDGADWPNYFIGITALMRKEGVEIGGFDCVFTSDIPIGAGLSSSAALCACLAFALNEIFAGQLSRERLVQLAQQTEHEFIGVQCGNMDQTASLFGKKGHVLRFDCRSFEITYAGLSTGSYEFVVCDSVIRHSHATSGYNDRKEACDHAVEYFQGKRSGVESLRDVSLEEIEDQKENLGPLLYKRAAFVLMENQRVIDGSLLLERGNLKAFGKLMYRSHKGLSQHYEVSCPEMDFLVDKTKSMDYVLGARMMGGGFGGCTINLVDKRYVNRFHSIISESYWKKFGHPPKILDLRLADGTHELRAS